MLIRIKFHNIMIYNVMIHNQYTPAPILPLGFDKHPFV